MTLGLTDTVGVAVVAVRVVVVHSLAPTGIARIVAVAGSAVGNVTVRVDRCGYVTFSGEALSEGSPSAEAMAATANTATAATAMASFALAPICSPLSVVL